MAETEATNAPTKQKRVSRTERSRQIWEQVEDAVRELASRRGWPHESLEDLDLAVRRLDEEKSNFTQDHWLGFHACMVFLDGAKYDCMEKSEIKMWLPMAKAYIRELEGL